MENRSGAHSKSIKLAAFAAFAALTTGYVAIFPEGLLGLEAPQWLGHLGWGDIAIYSLFACVLILASNRNSKVSKLSTELFAQQASELGFQERALNTHAIVCETDPDGTLTRVNDNFVAAFGYERSDLIGKSINMIYKSGGKDQVFRAIGETLSSGQVWSGENREITADGTTVSMQCTIVPMLDANGRHVKSVAIRTDITESQRDKSARFLNDLLDHLQDEVYIFDIETLGMRYANLKAMSRCGWTDADLQTKRIVDANRNFKEDFFRAHVAPLFTGEKDVVNIEFTLKNVSFEISTRRYTGECGQELFVSILRDTTERKKLELAKLETVSIVSHELRTPLTSIKGALRLLNSGALGPVSEKAKQVLDIADRNSERLLLVVNDILDLEKIRAGKMEFDLVPSDLLTLAIDAVELNKGYGDEHGVKFEFHSEVLQARANMSTDRMMQVMSNLMSNAAKFSPPGATVSVNIHRHMDCWRIGVTDEGPGIPESARASVFESFKQLDNVDDDKRKGTGLGLTISQKIIQAHGGSIDFECSNQKGTTFFVDLPALENDKTYLAAHPGIAAE